MSTGNKSVDAHVSAQSCVQPFSCCAVCAGMGAGSLLNSSISWAEDLCRGLLSCSPVNNLNYLKIQEPERSLCLNFFKNIWTLLTSGDTKPPGGCNPSKGGDLSAGKLTQSKAALRL